MNPVGIHFSYWTQEWSSEPIQFVKKARKCGFDILEVNAPKITRMSKAERDALKGAANDAELGLTYSIGMTADMDLVSEDPATRKKGISFLQDNEVVGRHYHGWDQLQLVAAQVVTRARTRKCSPSVPCRA